MDYILNTLLVKGTQEGYAYWLEVQVELPPDPPLPCRFRPQKATILS